MNASLPIDIAEAILWFHVVVIAFNVFGLVAIPLGAWSGWKFVRVFVERTFYGTFDISVEEPIAIKRSGRPARRRGSRPRRDISQFPRPSSVPQPLGAATPDEHANRGFGRSG